VAFGRQFACPRPGLVDLRTEELATSIRSASPDSTSYSGAALAFMDLAVGGGVAADATAGAGGEACS